jgi:hypothetical protein
MRNFLLVAVLLVFNLILIEAGTAAFTSGVSAQLRMRVMLRCYVPLKQDTRATKEIRLPVSDHAYSFVGYKFQILNFQFGLWRRNN